MEKSGRVLRERIQGIIGSLSPTENKENLVQSELSTAQGTPLVHAAMSGRSSVKDILALIDSERARRPSSAISVVKRLEAQNTDLSKEVQELNLRLMECQADYSKRVAELGSKHARHVSALQAELTTYKLERDEELAELRKANGELNEKIGLKYKRDEEKFRSEIDRAKTAMVAKEKDSRRKWENKKMAEIKEQTDKSFKCEIEKVLEAHRTEIETLRERHSQELAKQREEIERFHNDKRSASLEAERKESAKKIDRAVSDAIGRMNEEMERFRVAHKQEISILRDSHSVRERELIDRVENEQRMHEQRSVECQTSARKDMEMLEEKLKLEAAELGEQVAAEWESKYSELKGEMDSLIDELDRVKFDNTILRQQVRICERDTDILKATELQQLEARLREVLDQKNREIDQLSEKVAYLECRRSGS